MKAILICPEPRREMGALMEQGPPVTLPVLGRPMIEYWLVHMASLGAKSVSIISSKGRETVEAVVEDGARWGLEIEVVPTDGEAGVRKIREDYGVREDSEDWLPKPNAVTLIDHLPNGIGSDMFESYARWYHSLFDWLPHARTPERVGWREIRPGIQVGLHSRVSDNAVLIPPCWIGEKVYVGDGAVIGPRSVVENRAKIEDGSEIVRSIVGPATLVGRGTEVRDSIAWGDSLINWKSGSCLRVPDSHLLCSLAGNPRGVSRRRRPGLWTFRRPVRRPVPEPSSQLVEKEALY